MTQPTCLHDVFAAFYGNFFAVNCKNRKKCTVYRNLRPSVNFINYTMIKIYRDKPMLTSKYAFWYKIDSFLIHTDVTLLPYSH